jgi:hypothetical protein
MSELDAVGLTVAYKTWLSKQIPVVRADLAVKHQQLASSPLRLRRGTYYHLRDLLPAPTPPDSYFEELSAAVGRPVRTSFSRTGSPDQARRTVHTRL